MSFTPRFFSLARYTESPLWAGLVLLSPCFFASYLLGAIPFGWLLAKIVKGIDLRQFGSGNIGATNAGRALGRWAGLVVYLLDFAKGWAPSYFFPKLSGLTGPVVPVLLGTFAILGHCFPIYLKFRGGKGVATTTGVMFALDPLAFLLSGATWILLLALTRYVAIASIGLALSLPFWLYMLNSEKMFGAELSVLFFAAAISLFIVFTHRSNIRRLLKGEEPKIGSKV